MTEIFVYTGQPPSEIPKNIRHVQFKEKVTEIPDCTFQGCQFLTKVEFAEGLVRIGESAFQDCRSLRLVRLPSTVTTIEKRAFAMCCDLTSVEFAPQNPVTIGNGAFHHCVSLINIHLPAAPMTTVEDDSFAFCAKIHDKFSEESLDIHNALANRFQKLPLHNLCYHQSYQETDTIIQEIEDLCYNNRDEESKEQRFDCFGMTPLHLLALSARPNPRVFEAVLRHRVDYLIVRDHHGKLPLHYICLSKAPFEMFQLALDTQRSSFPDVKVDWKTLLWITDTVESYKYVVQSSIDHRIQSLGLEAWRNNLLRVINYFVANPNNYRARSEHLRKVHSLLTKYERQEVLSTLELAIWKSKIDQANETHTGIDRIGCRIHSGDQVIISNVLPFLGDYASRDYRISL